MSVQVRVLSGAALDTALGDVARLRIEVFREFPYLYDGNAAYEAEYLSLYREAPGAIVVAAMAEGRIVGAATGLPLNAADAAFAGPVSAGGLDPERTFYCAESVLLSPYRGRGIGHAFFDAREDRARDLGMTQAVFCAVERPEDHPARPADYRSLEPFWRKRGYRPLAGAAAEFSWKDVGDDTERRHRLNFWWRALDQAWPGYP